MLLAAGLSGMQLVTLGLLMLVIAALLRRGHRRGRWLRSRNVAQEVRDEIQQADSGILSQFRKMEVRLLDFGREVEGRMQTRIAQLDQLLEEADREIDQLQQLLDQSSRSAAVAPSSEVGASGAVEDRAAGGGRDESSQPLSFDQCRMIAWLKRAGYSPDEIATLIGRTPEQVACAINEARVSRQSDAA